MSETKTWVVTGENIKEINKRKFAQEVLNDIVDKIEDFENGSGKAITDPQLAISAIKAIVDIKKIKLGKEIIKIGTEENNKLDTQV